MKLNFKMFGMRFECWKQVSVETFFRDCLMNRKLGKKKLHLFEIHEIQLWELNYLQYYLQYISGLVCIWEYLWQAQIMPSSSLKNHFFPLLYIIAYQTLDLYPNLWPSPSPPPPICCTISVELCMNTVIHGWAGANLKQSIMIYVISKHNFIIMTSISRFQVYVWSLLCSVICRSSI